MTCQICGTSILRGKYCFECGDKLRGERSRLRSIRYYYDNKEKIGKRMKEYRERRENGGAVSVTQSTVFSNKEG